MRVVYGDGTVSGQPRTLARRYARALFEAARDQRPAAETPLRAELEGFVRLLDAVPELRSALHNPAITPEQKGRVLSAIAARVRVSPLLVRLLALLARHGRLDLLPELALAYAEERNRAAGVVTATAISAVALEEPQLRALAKALCVAVGSQVELNGEVDPGLLGGLLVRVGGRTYDGSVRARLGALRRRLAIG